MSGGTIKSTHSLNVSASAGDKTEVSSSDAGIVSVALDLTIDVIEEIPLP
jgi:hypothetical protein